MSFFEILASREGKEFEGILTLIGIGGFFVFSGVKRVLKARKIQDTARNQIAFAPQGKVEIEGFAWPLKDDYQTSDSTRCVYYTCSLQALESHGKNRSWVTKWTYSPFSEFLVMDPSGCALVSTHQGEIECSERIRSWSSLGESEIKKSILSSYGPISTGLFSKDYRIVEKFIRLGSPCYVLGHFQSSFSQKVPLSDTWALAFLAYLKKNRLKDIHKHNRFDLNRDGEVSSEEASVAMYSIASNTLASMAKGSSKSEDQEAVSLSGHISHHSTTGLIISDMHEYHMIKKVSQWNLVRIVGGALMVGSGVLLMIQLFTQSK